MRCVNVFVLVLSLSLPVQAEFWTDHLKQGWHWYIQEPAEKEWPDASESLASADPTYRIQAIRRELDRLKTQAVLEPTEQNILSYMTYQREQVLDRASTFSDQFRRVLWAHPDMDYTLERPTNALAKKVWLEKRGLAQTEAVKTLAKDYGLFFFFRSDCPYCQRFAPILKAFALQYGLKVMPISLDGGGLAEYPMPQLNQGQFERLVGRRAVVPAVLAVNPATQEIVPISYGLVTQEELLKRIHVLTQVEVGRDF